MRRLLLSCVLILTFSFLGVAQVAGPVTVSGQVVCCEDCWAKADRNTTPYGTRADLEQASECIANGDPTLLAVAAKDGGFTLYQLELGKFKRPDKNWLKYVGQRLEVSGSTRRKKDRVFIKVDDLKVLAEAIGASEPQINVIGSEVELALKDLFGVEQRLSAYRGRILILNFWATYCVPCKKEMPDLAAIQNSYAAVGVQVIGAASDTLAEQPKAMQFIKDARINFPIWLGATAEDMKRFGLSSSLPGTVIIGRDGKILAQIRGILKQADLRKQLDVLLAMDSSQATGQIASAPRTKADNASNVPS